MKHPIRSRFMYLAFQGLRAIVLCLPLRAAQALGRACGKLAFLLLGSQKQLMSEHLRLAFGGSLSAQQRQSIIQGVFTHLGQTAMEWMLLPRLSDEALQRLIRCEGLDYLKQALSQNRGVIALTGHFGNWELIPIYLRSLGFEGGVLARRLRHPEYESFLINMRKKRGVSTLARGSMKDVVRMLKANQIVGVMPDQDIDSLEGIFINVFGHPAFTPVGPAALSLMTGAPIVPCFMIREKDYFRLVIKPPVAIAATSDRQETLRLITQAWSDTVESYIRSYPAQWVWMHRRWKTKPAPSSQQMASEQPRNNTGNASSPPAKPAFSFVLCLLLGASCLLLNNGCAKKKIKPMESEPAVAQQMSEFTLTGYEDDGGKRWMLSGKGANVEGNIVTIHEPDGTGFDVQREAYLTASVAQVNQVNRYVRFENDVTIHTTDGLWLSSPIMHWIPDKNQVATDQSVRIETDHMLLRGREAEGQTLLKQLKILKDIELILNPSDHDVPGGPAHVDITCDGPLAFDYGNGVATFENNVHIKDSNGDLYSDKLIAYLDQATHTIRYAEAIGRVRIHQEQNTALSERAVYEPAKGKITLVGRPSLLLYPTEGSQGPQLSLGGLTSVSGKEKPASSSSSGKKPDQGS